EHAGVPVDFKAGILVGGLAAVEGRVARHGHGADAFDLGSVVLLIDRDARAANVQLAELQFGVLLAPLAENAEDVAPGMVLQLEEVALDVDALVLGLLRFLMDVDSVFANELVEFVLAAAALDRGKDMAGLQLN